MVLTYEEKLKLYFDNYLQYLKNIGVNYEKYL